MRLLLPLLFACVFVAGCHHASPLVGDWQASETVANQPVTLYATFFEDGKVTVKTSMEGKNGRRATISDFGTWKLDGNKLVRHIDDVQAAFSGPGNGAIAAQKRFDSNKAQYVASANKAATDTISWNGNDEFTSTGSSGHKNVFHRVH